jgi:threonine dehydratase
MANRMSSMQTTDATLSRSEIGETAGRIAQYIRTTPLVSVRGEDFGIEVRGLHLKLEALQVSGSFKARGAFANLVGRMSPEAGVVAASGGNHGAAVAFAAKRIGVPATIFVPNVSSPVKVERIRSYGATLNIVGERYADALEASERWAAQSGALRVHAFDQVETLLGQATIGLEIEQQVPDVDTILVPVGGGGLIGGIGAWFRGAVKIVGVEPEGAPTLTRALEAGYPVDAESGSIAADSLAPRRVGELMFPLAQQYVDRVVLVSDGDIRDAQRALWRETRVVAEPGGAAAFSALLSGRYKPKSHERVCVLVSGGNCDAVDFER